MNKKRRKEIADLCGELAALKSSIESAAQDERDYYDNMPENMQAGEKGTAAEEAADKLDEAAQSVEDAMGQLEEAAGG